MNKPYGIIYVITNLINNKKYVGQTTKTLDLRWKRHCWSSTLKGCQMPITMSIRKYNKNNFIKEVLCECMSQAELDEKEVHPVSHNSIFLNVMTKILQQTV